MTSSGTDFDENCSVLFCLRGLFLLTEPMVLVPTIDGSTRWTAS